MKIDAEAVLFSLKCFAAAMLAYYVALEIGLTRPYWAVTTTYITAQPLAGAVLSKAVFRTMGTILGAAAAVVLVPAFVNAPMVLAFALALWLGLCLYISQLDRTPRAYTFLLAGYTASIIGFPSVDVPGTIFVTSILRVEEILIGIVAAAFVHGVIFPRTVTHRLFARIDAILADAERWSRGSLTKDRAASLAKERSGLAVGLAELLQLSVHLPFDTARILPRVRTVRAFEDQLSMMLPLASTVEDRIDALAATPDGVPDGVTALLGRVDAWLDTGVRETDRDASAQALLDAAQALEPERGESGPVWHEMLRFSLLSRLQDLIVTHRDARDLRDQIRSPSVRAISPHVGELLDHAGSRALHRDHGIALRTALGTIATIMLGSVFWIATAWDQGAGAVLIAGVACALFGAADNAAKQIDTFMFGAVVGLVVAAVYAFAVMPRVTDFVMLAAVLAPALLIIGSALARPALGLSALGSVVGFVNTVGLGATYSEDFSGFINGAIGLIAGIVFSGLCVKLFLTAGPGNLIARLVRGGWRDVAQRARGEAPDSGRWMARMLDRIGLLAPRLAQQHADPGRPLLDALVDLRIGYVSGELAALRKTMTPDEEAPVSATLAEIARYFGRSDPKSSDPPPPALLDGIDRSVGAFAHDPVRERRRAGLLLLTSLRRNLFPAAPPWEAAAA